MTITTSCSCVSSIISMIRVFSSVSSLDDLKSDLESLKASKAHLVRNHDRTEIVTNWIAQATSLEARGNTLISSLIDTQKSGDELISSLTDTQKAGDELISSLTDTKKAGDELISKCKTLIDTQEAARKTLIDTQEACRETLKSNLTDTQAAGKTLESSLIETQKTGRKLKSNLAAIEEARRTFMYSLTDTQKEEGQTLISKLTDTQKAGDTLISSLPDQKASIELKSSLNDSQTAGRPLISGQYTKEASDTLISCLTDTREACQNLMSMLTATVEACETLKSNLTDTREEGNTLMSSLIHPPRDPLTGITNCVNHCKLWMKISPMDKKVITLMNCLPKVEVRLEPTPSPKAQLIGQQPLGSGMESAFNEVWGHIKKQKVGIVGVQGMGGVGKTTLLKKIHNKLRSSTHTFDLQLWVVISKRPNITTIQNEIGQQIGFSGDKWKAKTQEQKAADISDFLSQKKYILLLDDLWERLDLQEVVGVTQEELLVKNSKVIFTTRSEEVCDRMRASIQIKINPLLEEEAWSLFESIVGERALTSHPDLRNVATNVAKECKGLPLAIIVIGQAMSSKETIDEWKCALDSLRGYAAAFQWKLEDEVFIPLKYSYDDLHDDAIRSCFLYCCLYSEDREISKKELIDKWICEEFIVQSRDIRMDRMRGNTYISTLIKANLLEECSTTTVKMHDVIRDMAIWIGGEGGGERKYTYFVKAESELTEMPDAGDVQWEQVERMSLMDNRIKELKRPLRFSNERSKLKTLFLMNCSLESIEKGFFSFTPLLKVLDLSDNRWLNRSTLDVELFELMHLQYLSVNLGYDPWPVDLKKLTNLRYLNLTKGGHIPKGILSSLTNLRVLVRVNIFTVENGHIVKELEGLKYFTDLTTSIGDKFAMEQLSSSVKLMSCITTLQLVELKDTMSSDYSAFLIRMMHLEVLQIGLINIDRIVVWEHLMRNSAYKNCFNSLRLVHIDNCYNLNDLSWLSFAPNIEEILLWSCFNSETLISESCINEATNGGETTLTPFAKLIKLNLRHLPELQVICPTNLPFPCLKELLVEECKKLKKLPFNSSSFKGCELKITGQQVWWDNLVWDDETKLHFSSGFTPF